MRKYPKVLSLGQPLIDEIFDDPVEITEKVDGSQCRIHLTEEIAQCGSKNVGIADQKMFEIAHDQAVRMWNDDVWRKLGDDITLFTEFLNKEKHNVLIYSRVPRNNLYLFGAIIDDKHIRTEELFKLANILDIEPPHIIASDITISNKDDLNEYLKTPSILGNTVLEGIVIKNYNRSYPALLASTQAFFGYPLVGKIVRDDFKERLNKEWSGKKQREAPLTKVVAEFLTEARFNKAIQHLVDDGKITYEMNNLKDIIPEFYNDLLDEEKDAIIAVVMESFWKPLKRKCDNFAVQRWKEYLVEKQFGEV